MAAARLPDSVAAPAAVREDGWPLTLALFVATVIRRSRSRPSAHASSSRSREATSTAPATTSRPLPSRPRCASSLSARLKSRLPADRRMRHRSGRGAMLDAAERLGAPAGPGIAQRLLGLAAGGAEGLEFLRSAVESLQRSPRRLDLPRALVDYGAALRRRKYRADSREPLRRGLDLAQRCARPYSRDTPSTSCARPARDHADLCSPEWNR